MSSWSGGYVTEVEYTHGFYRELTPHLLAFAALARGVDAPLPGAEIAYCELGCGQGFTTNLLAAANPHVEFFATDFNPAHIAGAEALRREAGTPNVHFYDQSFQDFIHEPTLPRFDVIALHGIYSWISEENRRAIVRFIDARLKPGGLVYISYNAMPGWAPAVPLQRLMRDLAARQTGNLPERIDPILAKLSELAQQVKGRFFSANPQLEKRLTQMKSQNKTYLAHEYLNENWRPLFFSEVARDLSDARMAFVASAHLSDHLDAINLDEQQRARLSGEADPVFRETLRDFLVNQQFRRDVFARGRLSLRAASARRKWEDHRFILSALSKDIPRKLKGVLGEVNLSPEIYDPILQELESGPRSFGELMEQKQIARLGWTRLAQSLVTLVGQGNCHIAFSDEGQDVRRERTTRFNAAVIARTLDGSDLGVLASPVTGTGHPVSRIGQLRIAALQAGTGDSARFVRDALASAGHRISKDGRDLTAPDEILSEVRAQIVRFEERFWQPLQRIGIA